MSHARAVRRDAMLRELPAEWGLRGDALRGDARRRPSRQEALHHIKPVREQWSDPEAAHGAELQRPRSAVLYHDIFLALDGLRRAVGGDICGTRPEGLDAVGVGREPRVVPGQEAAAGERHLLFCFLAALVVSCVFGFGFFFVLFLLYARTFPVIAVFVSKYEE